MVKVDLHFKGGGEAPGLGSGFLIASATAQKSAIHQNVSTYAACVVARVDRLVHHAEIIGLKVKSYRRKEAAVACQSANQQMRCSLMSLLHLARNGQGPYAHFKDVLVRVPTHPACHLDDLLPHCWTPAE